MIPLALGLLPLLAAPAQDPESRVAPESSRPTLGNWHELVFHEASGQLVLLNGGPESGKAQSDPLELWCWSEDGWSALPSDGPRWRNFASAAYDARRGVIVLHGGVRPGEELADTWEWDGSAWRERPGAGPGPREGAALAFDSARGVCLLFGGAAGEEALGDTWSWDGERWRQVATTGPSPRFPGGFAFDPARERMLLCGGHTIDARGLWTHGDTWLWDGAAWEELPVAGPSARDGARAAYDPRSKAIVLFGGVEIAGGMRYPGEPWSFDGAGWTRRADAGPAGRAHAAFAFDARRRVLVLSGGSNAPATVLGDVWEHDGESWHCLDGCQ